MYDQLDIELNATSIAAESNSRRLEFSGAKNFRDLGGYPAAHEKTVRWKMLYRSDQLSKMTGADLKFLSSLALDRIIDLRADYEQDEEPDRLPETGSLQYVQIPILDSSTKLWLDLGDAVVQKLHAHPASEYLVKTNIELATRFTPEVREVIREVFAAKGRPLLFHCAAGKDRTGFAAAVLLRILGVPLEVVMEDYLLSNKYYFSAQKWNLILLHMLKGKRFVSAVQSYLEVRPVYLSAAFDAIDREYGSFEKYTRNGLGLTENDVDHLRAVYLE